MIRSVISVPSQTSKRPVDDYTRENSGVSKHESSRNKSAAKTNDQSKHSLGSGDASTSENSHASCKKYVSKRKASPEKTEHRSTGSDHKIGGTVDVTSIDGFTKLKWPCEAVNHTRTEPVIAYSCNPSFYDHDVCLSKEEDQRRTDLFIISDILDDLIDYIEEGQAKRRRHGKSDGEEDHRRSSRKSKKKKSKKKKKERTQSETVEKDNPNDNSISHGATTECPNEEVKRKHKKSKKRHKHKHDRKESRSAEKPKVGAVTSPSKKQSGTPVSQPNHTEQQQQAASQTTPTKSSTTTKPSSGKHTKKVKKSHKKKATPTSTTSDKPIVAGPSPAKKPKQPKKEEEKPAEPAQNSQKIKIAFTQNAAKPVVAASAKSKWDTSSDEEGSSRKGAISYRFSDDSDAEQSITEKQEKVEKPKPTPFGKMQPGGMLQTIEMNNPLPDLKPSVPIAHPNPGPDGAVTPARSKSRSRSYSRSRSRSSSRSYSSDDSHYRSRRKRGKRRRRSYTRSYSRSSRSRSYSSYSRSRSRSYSSRSYSRSHSRGRYRSSSHSSYTSYSSRSYSSRSRSRSPRYTRAVQPKYNNTRAFNMGKRKKFKKNKQFKAQQQPQQNPAIQKQLETGRAKAEETVMRLKRQKEEQQELQNRAMASIAAAASSAGITLPTTTATTNSSTKMSSTSPTTTSTATTVAMPGVGYTQNGVDLLDTFKEATQLAKAPAFLPRNIQQREFIGPVRPGVDPECEIPLPTDTPKSTTNSGDGLLPQFSIQEEPQPMEAPDTDDAHYKNLQEQAVKHIMSASSSNGGTDQLQQMAAAQYVPVQAMADGQIMIDPMTGQPVHVSAVHAAHAAHAVHQQQMAAVIGAHTPTDPTEQEDDKPAPHEAVIRSYADQVIMSNQKALVSQAQPVFTVATMPSSIPQAGVPIQTAPMMVNASQIQLAHAQMLQAQAAQAAQIQAAHLQNLQMQAMGLGVPQLVAPAGFQQLVAQQQFMQPQMAPQVMQLANGQLVVTQNPQQLLFQRFARPM